MPKELNGSNKELDELVEAISLTHCYIISAIPFKEVLESREELKDYEFYYENPLEKFNVLTCERIYGGQQNA